MSYKAEDFASEALVAMAGIVCTPERGYMEDGGPSLMRHDIESMIRLFKEEIDLRQRAFEIERKRANDLRCAIGDILRHQEIVAGNMPSAITAIAKRAIEKDTTPSKEKTDAG